MQQQQATVVVSIDGAHDTDTEAETQTVVVAVRVDIHPILGPISTAVRTPVPLDKSQYHSGQFLLLILHNTTELSYYITVTVEWYYHTIDKYTR